MSEELTPMNHRELWLKAIATGTVPEYLEPMTHEELWLKAIAQGGGSGGGGGEPLILHTTQTPISGGMRVELDKTAGEIYTALMSGKQIFLGAGTGGTDLYQFSMIRYNAGGFVTQLFNKAVINAEFNATAATSKPYYTSYGGGND